MTKITIQNEVITIEVKKEESELSDPQKAQGEISHVFIGKPDPNAKSGLAKRIIVEGLNTNE